VTSRVKLLIRTERDQGMREEHLFDLIAQAKHLVRRQIESTEPFDSRQADANPKFK